MSNYPTKKELTAIKKYDIMQGISGLIALIEPHLACYGRCDYDKGKLILATGGWSGCEDVISALQDNIVFWGACWKQSNRGGLYKFTIPKFLRK